VVDPEHLAETVAAADLVVNATPLGMVGSGTDRDPVPSALLGPGQVVADLVYSPRPTPWLAAAAARGATTLDGLGMLVHQAAVQIAWWTGSAAPVEAMWRAAEAARPGRT
jgi:shikimate dehydrogenase